MASRPLRGLERERTATRIARREDDSALPGGEVRATKTSWTRPSSGTSPARALPGSIVTMPVAPPSSTSWRSRNAPARIA
ncbi:MAG: hypothetical protein E2O39_14675 [Planctomycetota bacterium]|nr:MAG: hypothetical protein E2O39_14675 [Planctomycetota bacterium]